MKAKGEHPSISVVVGNHSGRYDTLLTYAVNSVLQCDYPRDYFEIIVVDNNREKSSFGKLSEMLKGCDRVRIVREMRRGIGHVRNTGFEHAAGDVVAYIDDDCEVDRGWLCRMAAFYADEDVMFGGGSVFDTCLNRYLRRGPDDGWDEDRKIIGGNMSFRRTVLERNRFDEEIIYGCDDFELVHRLTRQNMEWFFDLEPIKHHRAVSQYRTAGTGALSTRGRGLARHGELYFETKKRVFDRFYPRSSTLPLHLLGESARILKGFMMRRYWASRQTITIPVMARVQVYRDLRRLR